MIHDLKNAIEEAVNQLFAVGIDVELTRPEEQFGDYSTNVALKLAKQVGKNPRQIAEELAPKLREGLGDIISDISLAGPGFINLKLSDQALLENLKKEPSKSLQGKIVVAEYSDPNPFKPLHAGHLYTTLVGDVIARLQEVGGATVTRVNYGGDVGLHVGKSMWAIVKQLGGENPDKLNDVPEPERSAWLGERYVEGNNAYEDDGQAKTEIVAANNLVYELHSQNDHESAFAQIYWTCREWSYQHFEIFYNELEVHKFDRVIPESEVAPLGIRTVREQLGKGVYQESNGAVVFKGEDYGLHTRVFINSAGLPTYEAKDVGLMLTKWQDYNYDLSLYITGNEQAQYFEVMFKSVEQFAPEAATRARNITNGMVKLAGGERMSSRKGNILGALDVLAAATGASQKMIGKDSHETVLAAVKYAFLKNRTGGDIIYDPEESVSVEGNSGPYLQYAHARARSILSKAGTRVSLAEGVSLEAGERSLVRKIGEYADVVDKAVAGLMPHYICTYLYELAQIFNRFYENNRVIGDERQTLRLALVRLYADVLKQGLDLLGIASPDKM
jgi:arginyl-tRNA synthetase